MPDCTFIERKPTAGKVHAFSGDVIVGRQDCDVTLPDQEASRRHAAIRLTADGPAVEDLGSTNGTFVNGARISGLRPLGDGDIIRIGATEWQLQGTPAAQAGQTVAGAAPAQAPQAAPPPPPPPAAPRGDVPPPPEITPSAIHRTIPDSAASQPPAFAPVGTRQTSGSAATRAGYTAFCLVVFVATLVGVALYFIVN